MKKLLLYKGSNAGPFRGPGAAAPWYFGLYFVCTRVFADNFLGNRFGCNKLCFIYISHLFLSSYNYSNSKKNLKINFFELVNLNFKFDCDSKFIKIIKFWWKLKKWEPKNCPRDHEMVPQRWVKNIEFLLTLAGKVTKKSFWQTDVTRKRTKPGSTEKKLPILEYFDVAKFKWIVSIKLYCRSKNFSTGEKGISKCLFMDISSVNVDIFRIFQHVHRKGQSFLIILHKNTKIFYEPVTQERRFPRKPLLGRFTRRGGK